MKITQSLLAFAICGVLFTSCKENAKDENDTATVEILDETPAQLATASFTIEGMHCAVGCAGTIQKKLAKLEGVEEVDVDFDNKKATITYDANKQTPEILVQTVENISKDYIISDVTSSADKAFYSEKDKKKKNKKEASKNEETTEAKKECSKDKKACCASKKAETL